MRSASVFAFCLASSIISLALFSACETISDDFSFAPSKTSVVFFSAISREALPSLAAAKPSAISFCLFSIAFKRGGQTNLTVNQIKIAKVSACAIKVKWMFI